MTLLVFTFRDGRRKSRSPAEQIAQFDRAHPVGGRRYEHRVCDEAMICRRARAGGCHAKRVPHPKRIVVGYGFWIFLLSDIVMFSALFAAYAVLAKATAGGPTGAQLFDQQNVALETACLLLSSYSLRLDVNGHQFAALLSAPIWARRSRSCWERRSSLSSSANSHSMIAIGRGPATQRVSLRVFHAGRLPRVACDDRIDLAGADDGAARDAGASAPSWSAACFASPCSGTHSTSSGLGYSPLSI